MEEKQPVLELQHVSVGYDSPAGMVQAVNDVSLTIYENTIVGLIGESGSGKSTLGNAIMHLMKNNAVLTSGTIKVMGKDVYSLTKNELRKFRWSQMAMVFQSAMNALNPVLTVEDQILDVFLSHDKSMSKKEAKKRARELMDVVSIDPRYLKSYPHELSGGMRQRVVIAIAIALDPKLVIMDEPTTALDVVVQRSILDKIKEIQKVKKFAILFISHDFSLVSELASKVAIMYAGRFIEVTDSHSLMNAKEHHPYTEGLIRAIPHLTAEEVTIEGIPGNPPNLVELPTGCAYHPRCRYANELCKKKRPEMRHVDTRDIECHLYETVQK
ncbi:peptide/nickel transport system ATP-binding protein [Pullulanibacillus pueri]|uniref:ABC transporter ATP-binding protein n=1 Tax=Pullulanibacillus pueri TaxID=1437324 RepID=A0A8J3A0I9_9BACL|nr:ABC transporter ATP-binding protein [Pullulanibacillus pueri]MBM7680483.1 peptide/nickel transport system ATP-binding protein [Pullulanibacillus pueri]GGH88202.1 ABC transporter ATP-binding protein [Pullulanibacillus pueri]